MKDDLLKKHQIVQPDIGGGINHATFRTVDDFLEFAITGIKDVRERQTRVQRVDAAPARDTPRSPAKTSTTWTDR